MKKLSRKIDLPLLKYVAIVTAIIMLVAHGFCYFNMLYSHDSMNIFHAGYYGDSLGIGRFLIPVWTFIRGPYYPPVIIGALSTIFMILMIYFICKLFDVKNKLTILVMVLLLCTGLTITLLNATYINYADMYIFSLLLNVIAVYLIRKKGAISLLSIAILIISLGIYPAYLGVTLGLYIGLLIKDLVNDKNKLDVFKEGIKCIVIVAVSLIAYMIINKVILYILHFNLSDGYNSITNALNFDSFGALITCIKDTYSKYFEYFFKPHTFHRTIVYILNIVVVLIAIYNSLKIMKEKKVKTGNLVFIILLLLILPFALNIIYFITAGMTHELMIYGINITYVFIVLLVANNKSILNKIAYISLMFIAFCNIIFSNQVYEKKEMELESTINTINRVIIEAENTKGYERGKTPVVIVGNINNGSLAVKHEKFDYQVVGLITPFATTYHRTYASFISYYMGNSMNIVDKKDSMSKTANIFAAKKEVQEMPTYPKKGSIKMVDKKLVIKFSN